MQTAYSPKEIELILKLERNRLRGTDNHEVIRHPFGRLNDGLAYFVSFEPIFADFTRPVAVGVLKDVKTLSGLVTSMVQQWLQRSLEFCRRIGVKDDAPAGISKI